MFDKKGMILIESLFFMMILMILVVLLTQCSLLWNQMDQIDQMGYKDEYLQEIYQHD